VPLRVGRDVTALVQVLSRTMDLLGEPELDTAAVVAGAVGRRAGDRAWGEWTPPCGWRCL